MKIAHLSDLHLTLKFKPWKTNILEIFFEHLLEKNYDHLVITGDIAHNADKREFADLRGILDSYGFLRTEKTSIVIGNNDVFGGVQTAQDIINYPGKCLNINYSLAVKRFVDCFHELFESVVSPNPNSIFPYAKIIDDCLLVGINSVGEYSRLSNPFASKGYVRKDERKLLTEILKNHPEKKKVVMVHHHFYKNCDETRSTESILWNKIENFTMKLRGKKKLFKIMNDNNVDLVLHGHSHEMREYNRHGIRFLNAGGSLESKEENEIKFFSIDLLPADTYAKLNKIHLGKNAGEMKNQELNSNVLS